VQVSAGGIEEIGNLGLISPEGCVVTIASEPPIGACRRMSGNRGT